MDPLLIFHIFQRTLVFASEPSIPPAASVCELPAIPWIYLEFETGTIRSLCLHIALSFHSAIPLSCSLKAIPYFDGANGCYAARVPKRCQVQTLQRAVAAHHHDGRGVGHGHALNDYCFCICSRVLFVPLFIVLSCNLTPRISHSPQRQT